ncbi:PKD domain-containing protein [Paracrocinitomix mangrovi]|uniref:PKD domain-containing protein n=1 Tax=Paracrocinitomix mangrovi TaxID=2862509 RepID=UPI001C8D8524|nr:PKD domain-containing protein [Paracrocinitomix mangrovi]UKN02994.1 PKD domain-containing protein [Paracrocinitomix mangrovi]
MKWFKIFILTIGLWTTIGSQEAKAQIDTTFWFAAPWVTPDHDQNTPMAFHFSTFANATTIRLYQPAFTYDTTFTVPPNTLFSKYVSHLVNTLESKPADMVLNWGFKIESDYPIIAVYDFISSPNNGSSNNPETYSLKGQNGMGYEFVTPFQTLWNNKILTNDNNSDGVVTQPKQFFSVVATEDNTVIYITPKCDVVGHPADITYSVTLPLAGQVYTCENVVSNTSAPGNSLAGSIVVSNKPVSVTVNDDSVNPSGGGGCYDLMGDQIVPTDVIGKEYIVNKGFLNVGSNESIFVVATENFTTVNIDNGITTTSVILNQGDTYQYSITEQLTSVHADKNVYLLHMSGYGCELGKALLPPLNCAGSDQVSFTRTNGQSFLLDIVCPAGSEGNFTLNGSTTLVQASDFNPVPGTGGAWMGAQISFNTTDIPINTANLLTNSSDYFSLGIINGGATTGCLYHYISPFLRRVYVDAGNDTTLCSAETIIDLNGSVTGGVSTGIWSVLDGSGTLNSPTNLSTTYDPVQSDYDQGSLTFVLQSTGNCDPRYDTLVVDFIESPDVSAGLDDTYCKNNVGAVSVSGSLQFALASTWSGGNGGSFGNVANLNTTYTPSPTDLANDSVVLYLTSSGSFFACPDDEDTLVIYFSEPPSVFAGADQVICSSTPQVALNGTVSGPTTTGEWTTSGSGAFSPSEFDLSNDYLISAADTATGTVTLVLTSTNNGNCLAVADSLTLTILDKPTVTITSEDSLCANVPNIDLTGTVTSGFTTTWIVNGTGSIADPNSLNTTYGLTPTDTSMGSIWIYLETTGGICPIETDSLEVQFVAPPVVFAGLDQNHCSNEVVALNGTLSGTASGASWSSLGTGTFNPGPNLLNTFYEPSPLDISNGSVNLILTSTAEFGCLPDDDTLTITYLEVPVADFSSTSACTGENTFFTDLSTIGSGSITTWQYDFGNSNTSIAQNPIHNYSGSGNFVVTLIAGASNGCFDTIQQNIWINPVPVANFTNNYACENDATAFIDATFLSSGSIQSWSWDFANGAGTSNIQNPSYTFGNEGTYSVSLTVVSDSGCVGTVTNSVDVLGGPTAAFSVTPVPALALEQVFFTDESNDPSIVAWYWDYGDGIGGFNQNEIHTYQNGGYYDVVLTVTDTAGCQDTAVQNIQVILEPALPTAFTPNNDGENDFFLIRGGPFQAVDFKIFSNWGALVYSTTDVNHQGWDGQYNGTDAPVGVYSWTYTVIMPGGKEFIKEGDVTLMR